MWPGVCRALRCCEFFFAELTRRARALPAEIHQLARSYHWEESTILRLSYARRGRYLALLEKDEHANLFGGFLQD